MIDPQRHPPRALEPSAPLDGGQHNSSPVLVTPSWISLVLSKRLWFWPLFAIVVLSVMGIAARSSIHLTMRDNVASELRALLGVEVAMLNNWLISQKRKVNAMTSDLRLKELVNQLNDLAPTGVPGQSGGVPSASAKLVELRRDVDGLLGPILSAEAFAGYFLADRELRILAGTAEFPAGGEVAPELRPSLLRAGDGEAVVVPPFLPSRIDNETGDNPLREVPLMFVIAPIRSTQGKVTATLGLRIRPEREFGQIMQLGRRGLSGETIAFNAEGRLVSNSRFETELIAMGLLPPTALNRSMLHVSVRDPGLPSDARLAASDSGFARPLTRMAQSALAGHSGVDVEGFRDYRGQLVVGAWTWLDELQIGVGTKIDHAEALRPMHILQQTFNIQYALLLTSAFAIFVFTVIVARLRCLALRAAMQAKALGQYQLLEKIGEGTMGIVYCGYHAILRRPTAIKMLHAERVNDESIRRFEHEVKITCRLNHPNTVRIYDYGRTSNGVFYYAMELVDGMTLQSVVDLYGPLPESRVIHILLQLCGSLYEAHSQGLVHRDIKPSNIMLSRSGGETDVVKVLDFGLVKAIDDRWNQHTTKSSGLTGTPLYMSPEAILTPASVDFRSDLYSVGGVAYFLLTGQTVFDSQSIIQLLDDQVHAMPVPPSLRLGKPVSIGLEKAILACLAKDRDLRPSSARELMQSFHQLPKYRDWTWKEADHWWASHETDTLGRRVEAALGRAEALESTRAPESCAFDVSTASVDPGLRTVVPSTGHLSHEGRPAIAINNNFDQS